MRELPVEMTSRPSVKNLAENIEQKESHKIMKSRNEPAFMRIYRSKLWLSSMSRSSSKKKLKEKDKKCTDFIVKNKNQLCNPYKGKTKTIDRILSYGDEQ